MDGIFPRGSNIIHILAVMAVIGVQSCPQNCSCLTTDNQHGRITVKCISTDLRSFPSELPSNTQEIMFINNPHLQWPTNMISEPSWANVTSVVFENNLPLRNLSIQNVSWLSNISSLTVRDSHLEWIQPTLFGALPNLEYLDLSRNPKLEYNVIFEAFNSSNVNLDYLNISTCNDVDKQSILQHVHLQNLLKTPLKVLDMSSTNLFDIEPGIRHYLPLLEVLNISGNHLKIDFRILCDIALLSKLILFDISHWSTPDLFYRVERSIEGDTSNSSVNSHSLTSCPVNNRGETSCFPLAETLRLFYFHHIRWSSAESPTISKCLSKNNMTKVWLNNNNYRLFNGSIRGAGHLVMFDISQNKIEYFSPEFFFYEPLLQVLNLSVNRLHTTENHINFTHLIGTNQYMQHIDLSYNGLTHLPYNIFNRNTQMISINLAHNQLCDKLMLNLTSPWLRVLDLSYNKIAYLDETLRAKFDKLSELTIFAPMNVSDDVPPFSWSNFTLDLSNNSFSCECHFSDFLIWVKTTNVNLRNFENYECIYKGERTRLSKLTVQVLKSTCDFKLSDSLLISAILIPIAIIGILLAIVLSRRIRQSKIQQKVQSYSSSNPPRYVAFMCYSHHDSDFVLSDLRPELEGRLASELSRSNGLLCINDRDFCIGEPIEEAIVRSVVASSMVILVISEKFLDSQWCKFETNVAWMERKPILMILRHKIDLEKLPHMLRNIYNKHVRLLWMGEERKCDFIDTLYKSIIKQL